MDWKAGDRAEPRRITQRFVGVNAETRAVALRQKPKDIARTANLAQQ